MGDDVTEWDNPVHVERKCPLCGATRTRFVDVYSDGDEVVECSFGRQKCKGCGLSCKHWDAIDALTAENAELREKVADYVDTVSAMVTAATGTEDIDEQERLLNAAGPKPSCFIAELRKRVEVAEHQRDRALAAFTELKMVSLPPHDVSGTSMWDKATAAVADVRRESVAKPCAKCEFPTPEAVVAEVEAIEASFERSNSAMHACYADAKQRGYRKGNGGAAAIVCPVCGGQLHYSVASYNGHMHGRCETEGCVAWMQ